MAETTQNELIAEPSSLSSHGKAQRRSTALVRVCESPFFGKKYPFSVCVGSGPAKGVGRSGFDV